MLAKFEFFRNKRRMSRISSINGGKRFRTSCKYIPWAIFSVTWWWIRICTINGWANRFEYRWHVMYIEFLIIDLGFIISNLQTTLLNTHYWDTSSSECRMSRKGVRFKNDCLKTSVSITIWAYMIVEVHAWSFLHSTLEPPVDSPEFYGEKGRRIQKRSKDLQWFSLYSKF